MQNVNVIIALLDAIITKEGNNVLFERTCRYLNSDKRINKIKLIRKYFKSDVYLKWAVNLIPYFPINGGEFMTLKDEFDTYFLDYSYDEIKWVIHKGILFETFTEEQINEFLKIITQENDDGLRMYRSFNNFSDLLPYISKVKNHYSKESLKKIFRH